MKSAPNVDEIFSVIAAASVGDADARIAIPNEADSDDLCVRLSVELNHLLDVFSARIKQLQTSQVEIESLLSQRTIQLEKSDDKFAKAFRATPAGLAIALLPEGRWIELNDAFAKMTGYTREELLGHTSVEMGLMDSVAREKILQAIKTEGVIRNVETQFVSKSKKRVDVLVSIEQIELDGQPCALSIQYDITERKQLEATVMELALERSQANMFQRFIGGASHDLRTPLATIKTSLYLLKKTIPTEQSRYLSTLESQTSQIEHIVEDMIYLSALDKELILDLQTCELGTLIKNVVTNYQVEAKLKNQALSCDSSIDSPIVADKHAIEQTLSHLINNAINYTPDEGIISVYALRNEAEIVITVADNGIGISDENLPQIFDRFYRVDKARSTATGGTGIGLSICKKIVERHGGRIWAESVLGRGSVFSFSLPLDFLYEG